MRQVKDGDNVYDVDNVGMVSSDEVNNDQNGFILNMDLTKIPDLHKLTSTIIEFLEYINTPEMERLEQSDKTAFEKHLEHKFENFTVCFTTIYKMLLNKSERNENLTKLMDLIETLKKVQSGEKNMDVEFDNFREQLSEQYVYPKFGGKEQFEKNIEKRARKKNKKLAQGRG